MADTRRDSLPVGGKHKGVLLSVRVEAALRDAIRQHRERLQRESPYRQLSDSDAVRDLILRGLSAVPPKKAR